MPCIFDEDFRASGDDQSVFPQLPAVCREFPAKILALVRNLTALTEIAHQLKESA